MPELNTAGSNSDHYPLFLRYQATISTTKNFETLFKVTRQILFNAGKQSVGIEHLNFLDVTHAIVLLPPTMYSRICAHT